MLYGLIFINFIVCIQIIAEEASPPSVGALTDAMQQAAELQREASKLISENLARNPFAHHFPENQHLKKGCPSRRLGGKANQTKGCVGNITPPISPKENHSQENADRILVFVSFSMPEASLKGLAQEAERVSTQRFSIQEVSTQKHNAVLVIRGLYQNSFAKTAQKLQQLDISVDINPELFETHQIAAVPTFVLMKGNIPTHSLKGNVSLEFAAQKFEDQQIKEGS